MNGWLRVSYLAEKGLYFSIVLLVAENLLWLINAFLSLVSIYSVEILISGKVNKTNSLPTIQRDKDLDKNNANKFGII